MKRILLLEDDPVIAGLEMRIMSLAGLLVHHSEDTRKAHEALEAFGPDLVLSDLQLAYGSIGDTLRFLATISSRYPVVVSSGSLDIGGMDAECKAAGCVSYISKTEFCRMGSGKVALFLLEAFNSFHRAKLGGSGKKPL